MESSPDWTAFHISVIHFTFKRLVEAIISSSRRKWQSSSWYRLSKQLSHLMNYHLTWMCFKSFIKNLVRTLYWVLKESCSSVSLILVVPLRTLRVCLQQCNYNEKENAVQFSPVSSLLFVAVRFIFCYCWHSCFKKPCGQHTYALSSMRCTIVKHFWKSLEFSDIGSS